MKRLLTICLFGLACELSVRAQVAITRDGSQPDSSAMLDIKSTARGVLIPRMSTVQRQAIVSPALGLMVFDSDQKTFFYYSGTAWAPMATGAAAGNPWKVNTGGMDFWDSTVTTLYTDSAYVGIGTHTPFSPLSIVTKDFTWGMTHTNGSVRVGTFVGEGGGWIATATPSPLYFGTSELFANVDPQMAITTAGTVGINTRTPNEAYRLDVSGSIHCANNLDASAGVTALGIIAKDSVKTNRFSGTTMNLSGTNHSLNFQQPTGTWSINEAVSGDLEFSYTDIQNNIPKTIVFIMSPDGAFKGPKLPTSKADNQAVQPGQEEIIHQARQNDGNAAIDLSYEEFSRLAIRAIQKQQAEIQKQQTGIKDQQSQIKSLTDRLEALEQKVSMLK